MSVKSAVISRFSLFNFSSPGVLRDPPDNRGGQMLFKPAPDHRLRVA